MLDLFAVKNQIDEMVADERRAQEDYREKLEMAESVSRLAEGLAKISWRLPVQDPWLCVDSLRGRLNALPPAAAGKDQHCGDGWVQIFPIGTKFSCFLIEAATSLPLWHGEKPLMSSKPTLSRGRNL